MISVVNLHQSKVKEGFYIGRTHKFGGPSPLANPFTVEEHGRIDCIRMYMAWLTSKIDQKDPAVMGELKKIAEKSSSGTAHLFCHCKPKACHGDVIMLFAEDRASEILEWEDAQEKKK